MNRHPDLRYCRTENMVECRLRGARIAYASAVNDGPWKLRCNGDDYPSWHDDYESPYARWSDGRVDSLGRRHSGSACGRPIHL